MRVLLKETGWPVEPGVDPSPGPTVVLGQGATNQVEPAFLDVGAG